MKPWLKLGSVAMTLALLAACSSGLQALPGIQESEITPQADSTAWQRIAIATDDAEETLSTGATVLDSIDLDFGSNTGGNTAVGVRFTGLGIPKGAVVKSANLYFLPKADSIGSATMSIQMHSSYTSNTFKTTNRDITSRYLTSTSVSWAVPTWKKTMTLQSLEVKSPNLSSLVQPLVSNGAVDALTFVLKGTGSRIAESFEGTAGNKPAFEVIYTMPATTRTSCLTSSSPVLNWTNQAFSTTQWIEEQAPKTGMNAKDSKFLGKQPMNITSNPPQSTPANGYICLSGGYYASKLVNGDDSVWDCKYLPENAIQDCRNDGSFHSTSGIQVGDPGYGNFGPSTYTTIENVAIGTTGDGIAFKRQTKGWTVRNAYIRHAGDDGIESDFFNDGVVDNVLIDWAYAGFSCDNDATSNATFTIKNSLAALRPQNGVYGEANVDPRKDKPAHIRLFKWNDIESNGSKAKYGCKLVLQNNVFMMRNWGGYINPQDNPNILYSAFDPSLCKNNLIIYLGDDSGYKAQLKNEASKLPAGCFDVRVVTSTVSKNDLITLWRQKRSQWFDKNSQFESYRAKEPVAPGM